MEIPKTISLLLVMATVIPSCNVMPLANDILEATIIPSREDQKTPSADVSVGPDEAIGLMLSGAKFVLLDELGNPGDGSVAVSDNGEIAAISENGGIRIWSIESGQEAQEITGLDGKAYVIALSADASLLAFFDLDFSIEIWDLPSRSRLFTLGDNVMTFAFSPDSLLLASGHSDQLVRIWDMQTGNLLQTLPGHTGAIDSVAFSPNGSTLASGEVNTGFKIILWDVESGEEILSLEGHTDNVYALAFSPDGNYVASASGDRTIKIWDLSTGIVMQTFRGHTDRIYSVVFSPDGTLLASGSSDRTVRIWDPISGEALQILRGGDYMNALSFSKEGSILFTSDEGNPVKIWGFSQ
jgi:WD40 repeat protein